MKKICLLLCFILVLQMLCACNTKKEEFESPVSFYYGNRVIAYNTPTGVIRSETREGKNICDSASSVLSDYMQGPKSAELQNLFPEDTQVLSCHSADSIVNVELSVDATKLSGITLTTASAAMLMTLNDCLGVESLYVSVIDPSQEDRSEIVIDMDDIALMDMLKINE